MNETELFECTHDTTINDGGVEVCLLCGLELTDTYTFFSNGIKLKECVGKLCYDAVDYGQCLKFLDDELDVKSEVIHTFDTIVGSRKNIHQAQKTGIMAACAYYVCVDMNAVRMTEEIVDHFKITMKRLASGCRVLYEHFPRFRCLDPSPSAYLTSVLRYVNIIDVEHRRLIANFILICESLLQPMFSVDAV